MAQAVYIHNHGGPNVMEFKTIDIGQPGPEDVRLRHTAIGLNFIDCYHRSGLYPTPLPTSLGLEAAAVVEAVGSSVTTFKPGDRVGYCWGPLGAYTTHRLIPADQLIPLPDFISDEQAAALLLKGCTAEYLIRRTYNVKAGDRVLFHAAAGGVGLISCQWLKALGAHVIGTVGSEEKAELAKKNGCDDIIFYDKEDIATHVKDITSGQGVDVVFDGVGQSTWLSSLDSLKPRGTLVSFGNASGPVRDVDLGILALKGSLYATRPTLMHYYASPQEKRDGSKALFNFVKDHDAHIHIGQRFALADAAEAHRALESRKTIGSTVLIP